MMERRAHPRLQCKGIAEMNILPDGPKVVGSLTNLSLGGCRIESSKEFQSEPYAPVEVQLTVDDSRLRLAGVIRFVEDNVKVGVQFAEVSQRKEEQIRLLIAELAELEEQRAVIARQMRKQEEAEDQ
jgi:c-di-GMP-binding flagellar brake protein YcgR